MYKKVFLVGTGSYLPGEPVSNEQIDKYIKPLNSKSNRLRNMILRENGIETRHYGIDEDGQTRVSLAEMGASAIREALASARLRIDDLDMLTAGTCAGDLLIPGFANMLQGELKAKPMETSSHIGICASGVTAMRHAADSIELGRTSTAAVAACEFPSRMFKSTRFAEGYDVDFDSHFLRWMLSDGAGAFILSQEAHPTQKSLQVKHIHLKSFSGDYPTCMYIGTPLNQPQKSYFDYPSLAEADKEGAFLLRQNVRMLPQLFEVCLHEYADLIKRGVFKPSEISHFVTHYSSQKFEGVMADLLEKMDVMIPKEKWFSNLKYRGNMGSASIFIMLDDLLKSRDVQVGEKILCFIPESGRFSVGFILLEVVGPAGSKKASAPSTSFVEAASADVPVDPNEASSEKLRTLLLELAGVWHDFRSRMWRSPYFTKITSGDLKLEQYLSWIENWAPQVREGSKWMRTTVANLQDPFVDLKDLIEHHAEEEQNDWKVLFEDYKRSGGLKTSVDEMKLNSGGELLNNFMYSRAKSVNAVDLLGGIYIIEGTGQRIIPVMLPLVRSQLKLGSDCFKFLHYHGVNDEHHLNRWLIAVQMVLEQDKDGSYAKRIVETARTVAHFYCQQMEEVLK
jgi:3-oxoacyl-[acyl-carrier-protein] synthase-3